MKKILNIMTLLGLFLALFALAPTSANAQSLSIATFRGTFTLPLEAQWGGMTLPAGEYSLSYGLLGTATYMVEVVSEEKANPHGLIRPGPVSQVPTSETALICIRDGNKIVVRELRMADIGGSISFALPRGVEVETKSITKHQDKSGNDQIAQVAIRVEPVRTN